MFGSKLSQITSALTFERLIVHNIKSCLSVCMSCTVLCKSNANVFR